MAIWQRDLKGGLDPRNKLPGVWVSLWVGKEEWNMNLDSCLE